MPAGFIRIILPVLFLLGGFGCQNPHLTITHWLPGPAYLPIKYTDFLPGKCVLVGLKDTDLQDYARTKLVEQVQELRKRYAEWGQSKHRPAGQQATVEVVFTIEVEDEKQSRMVKQGNPMNQEGKISEVASLFRQINLHAEFHVQPQIKSNETVTLEVRREYSSRDDVRTRGPWGLQRPDDPKNVPAIKTIVRELLAGSINAFYRMVAPIKIEARMQLKPTLNRRGRNGLKQTFAGNCAAAVTSFQAGLNQHPKDKYLWYNLAVAAEAAGQLDRALDAYETLAQSDPDKNSEIHQAVKRVKRVIDIQKDLQRYK